MSILLNLSRLLGLTALVAASVLFAAPALNQATDSAPAGTALQVSPELFAAWEAWQASPHEAASFVEHVAATRPALADEALAFGRSFRAACECKVLAAFDARPLAHQPQAQYLDESQPGETWRGVRFSASANRAAHVGDLAQWSSGAAQENEFVQENEARLTLALACLTQSGERCAGETCSADLFVYGEYATHVSLLAEQGAGALAADGARLVYQAGAAAPVALFQKWIAVSHAPSREALETVQALTGLAWGDRVQRVALADNQVKNLLGQITLAQHAPEPRPQNMSVAHQNLDSPGELLGNGGAHALHLHSLALLHAANDDQTSQVQASFRSSYALTAAVANFDCAPGVTKPLPTAVWSYAALDGPRSEAALRQDLHNFFLDALDRLYVNVSSPQNYYPRQ